jgi:hypothetical protein
MADISYDKHGAVRLITINRADKMNSLDFAANDELIDIWHEFDRDDQARVAVITGAGDKSFCAGADLKTYTLKFAQAAAPEFRDKYTNGPGFRAAGRPDLTNVDTTDLEFLQEATVPLASETHAGEDVAIYARGPKAHLVRGSMEQNWIYHVMMEALK